MSEKIVLESSYSKLQRELTEAEFKLHLARTQRNEALVRLGELAKELEQCKAPEYHESEAERERKAIIAGRLRVPPGEFLAPSVLLALDERDRLRAELAELRDQVDDDNTNAAAVNDLLIKLQNVTAERDRLVDENKQVTIDYGIAVKSHNRQQEAYVACKNEVDRLVSQLAAVTAERDDARDQLAASEIELADKAFYVREFADVSAERDGLKKRNDVQAEQLIRIESEISPLMSEVAELKAERDAARAELAACMERAEQAEAERDAIRERAAVSVPAGVPSVRDLREIGVHAYLSHDSAKRENAGCMVGPMGAAADAILTALAPWLREPVGWELDVTINELAEVYCNTYSGKHRDDWQAVLDLCRSRIRPAFECKECAYKQTRIHRLEGWVGALEGYCDDMRKLAAQLPARAALEGE